MIPHSVCVFIALAFLSQWLAPVHAQLPAPPAARGSQHSGREVADYLQLSAEQRIQLSRAHSENVQQLNGLAQRAEPLRVQHDTRGLQRLCEASQRLQQAFHSHVRSMLTVSQMERLAALDQAFSLMPIVQSAQAAGLMSDRLSTSPAGFPQGQVSEEVSFVRARPAALPGCPLPAQQVRPGTVDSALGDRPSLTSDITPGPVLPVPQTDSTGSEPKR